ncbi:MAG TPA: ankyrin repeat domain-containing protein, partial [Candidatus Saccharimonadales bacterium]|nr:ankyrin repeat domain-containing protein [Candidatus Saccharimonadales bacterium]
PSEHICIQRAMVNNILGNHTEALMDCNHALGLKPDDAIALNHRAIIYDIMNETKHAESDRKKARILEKHQYNKAVIEELSNEYLFFATAELKKAHPNLKAVLIYCNEAIRLDGSNSMSYQHRAKVCRMMGHYKQAMVDEHQARMLIHYPTLYKDLFTAIKQGKKEEALSCLNIFSKQASLAIPSVLNDKNEIEPVILTLARYGYTSWIDDLFTYLNIDFNVKDEYGNSVLHIAAQAGHMDFFIKLINKNLFEERKSESFNLTCNAEGENPFHSAAMAGKDEFLIKMYAIPAMRTYFQAHTSHGETILHILIEQGHTQALINFLEAYPSFPVGEFNYAGQNIFMLALLRSPSSENEYQLQLKLLEMLIARHADLYAQDMLGLTVLHLAVQTNQINIVKFLLTKTRGTLINMRDKKGNLPNEYTASDSAIGRLLEHAKQDNTVVPKDYSTTQHKWENLVFQGGSVKGLAYLSALRELEEQKIISLHHDIKRVGGTSAGAITALLIGLGFNFDEIEHLSGVRTIEGSTLPQIKFSELLDGPHGATILTAKNKDWSEEKNEAQELITKLREIKGLTSAVKAYQDGTVTRIKALKDKLENDYISLIEALNKDGGLCPGHVLYHICDTLIKMQLSKKLGKEISASVTFQELKDAGFKEIYFVGVNTRTGLAEVFSHQDTPNMLVANAVRISMSIPGVFTPVHKMIKEKGVLCRASADRYVDGGLLLNFPIELFDFTINQQGCLDRNHPKINKSTLGLRLSRPSSDAKVDSAEELSIINWFTDTLKNLYKHAEDSGHLTSGDAFRTVYLNVDVLGMLDFELADQRNIQDSVCVIGRDGVREFIERTSQQKKPEYVTLPDILEQECQKYMIPMSQKVKHGIIKKKFKLNLNCPGLVLAFYKDSRKTLHDYLHHHLEVSIFAPDAHGMTAFHLAVIQNEPEVLKRLLTKAPEGICKKNADGHTPYQLAVELGNAEIILFLNSFQQVTDYHQPDEVKSTRVQHPFFRSTDSRLVTSGSELCYLYLLHDVKQLLEQIKTHDSNMYTRYHSILKMYDKKCEGTAEDYKVLTQLKEELSGVLEQKKPTQHKAY